MTRTKMNNQNLTADTEAAIDRINKDALSRHVDLPRETTTGAKKDLSKFSDDEIRAEYKRRFGQAKPKP